LGIENLGTVLATLILLYLASRLIRFFLPDRRIVSEHQRALRYRRGKIIAELGPGQYWLQPRIEWLRSIDTRWQQEIIKGQEVLTSDRVPLKVSMVAHFRVVDIRAAISTVEDFGESLYAEIQLALRQTISQRDLDSALEDRGAIGEEVQAMVNEHASSIGLDLHSVRVRDFMLSGSIRNAYAEVIEAKQQGLAALERARGESASLRSLANAATLLDRNPGMLQLRLLQAVESGTGNKIVIHFEPDGKQGTMLSVEPQDD
jgi:regulator of protease activity HflC (stomatin/prohibitin superfamily)